MIVGVALLLAAPAPAAEPAEVAATGNPVTGGLGYDPAAVDVAVGQTVRWTNTDVFAPHTATEVNGLWDLGGDYGATPLTPSGFGPGDSVERRFEAGAWDYYCRVHGTVQSGTVAVPVTVGSHRTDSREGKPRYAITARWSRTGPAEGQVFDVQMRRAGSAQAAPETGGTRAASAGAWRLVREDVRQRAMRLGSRARGTTLEFRARVHSAGDAEAASGWSPSARITAG